MPLITIEELKQIDIMWDNEGDLTRRNLVDIYYNTTGKKLPWDQYKVPVFSSEVLEEVERLCDENSVPFELISKLIIEIKNNMNYTKSSMVTKAFDRVINQGWLHYEQIEKGLQDDHRDN